ncbi:MAG: 2'-5' RNA ligase family protein [Clostridia bacterium]|nr:2'-5' RNA ligase family protein [Clostridia bacterium]
MYIWTGIDVDGQLRGIKDAARTAEEELGMKPSCFTLPMHISLKIPFFVSDDVAPRVISELENRLLSAKRFEIDVDGIRDEGNIIWIRMTPSKELDELTDDIVALTSRRFDVEPHEYDCDRLYHTTLFMDADRTKMQEALTRVKHIALPKRIAADRFIIGTSESGELGSFKVIRTLEV